jgi:hypothetical protein
MNHVSLARVVRALMVGASCEQLVEETGLHIVTVRNLVALFRREGVTFISGWLPDARGGMTIRVHRLRLFMHDKDAPCPVSRSTIERRRYAGA